MSTPVSLSVEPISGGDGCQEFDTSGGYCAFVATGGEYEFIVTGQAGTGISYSGNYAVPLWNVI